MKKKNLKKRLMYIACGLAGVVVVSFLVVMLTRPENLNGQESINSVSAGDIVGNHIYHEYDESFIVDADITSTAPKKADILYAKYYQPNEKKLWSAFFDSQIPNGKVNAVTDDISYNDGKNYMLIDESYITGDITPDYIQRKLPIVNFTTKYESWTSGNVYPNPLLDTMYKKESLSFMTPDDAVEYVYSILQELNIEVSKEDVDIYTIDRETMQRCQDEIVEEDPYAKEIYGYFKETFEDDDEFYILNFTTIHNQIPVTHAKYIFAETRSMYGSDIKIYLSKKGIFKFYLTSIYQVEDVGEYAENFITAQEALDKAYKENVLGIKLIVDEIRFEYVPVPYNSNYEKVKLTPAWTIHMYGTQVDGHEIHETIMIDAVTGEKIG